MAETSCIQDDWVELRRAFSHVLDVLASARDEAQARPALSMDEALQQRLANPEPLPEQPGALPSVLKEAERLIFSGYCNVSHPRYFGYISPRPLMAPLVGDLLASGLNQVPGAWRAGAGATVIEAETLVWLADFVGFPRHPGRLPHGIFVGGGTLANASALKLARDTLLGRQVQQQGLTGLGQRPTFYMSREGHFSVWRGLDLLGLGRESLRLVDVDATGRIDMRALRETLARDVAQGMRPTCVVGVAGSSATGAVDPLAELAAVAREHRMWFHVDGASGAVLARHPRCEHLFTGLDQADSLTIDPCKWLFLPFGIGALLVKDGRELFQSFSASGHYWEDRGEVDLFQMSPYGTRQWRSLGLWMTLKHLGRQGYLELLGRTLEAARHLARRVSRHEELELLHEPSLPICSFRLRAPTREVREALNAAVQRALITEGHSYISLLDWRGDTWLRVAINNYTTAPHHLDELIDAVLLHRRDYAP